MREGDVSAVEGSERNGVCASVIAEERLRPLSRDELERSGALVSVRLELEEGQRLSAAVTAGAVAELGITEGREVCCVIKAVQVRILARRG